MKTVVAVASNQERGITLSFHFVIKPGYTAKSSSMQISTVRQSRNIELCLALWLLKLNWSKLVLVHACCLLVLVGTVLDKDVRNDLQGKVMLVIV
jgi:hypothetical protein